jgi:hypothetical protein
LRTPAGTECRYYYEDFHRGRQQRECRLILANRDSLDWQPDICAACAVPAILRANGSPHLRLHLGVRKQLRLFTRLDVRASCAVHGREIDNPYLGCPDCAAELLGGHDATG